MPEEKIEYIKVLDNKQFIGMDRRKILIVDDEEDLCEILQFNLNNAGYSADVAYSAEGAYAKLKNGYDLILLDVMMGAISGFKLAEIIRQDFGEDIPIIFVTALGEESHKLQGFGLGADDYISKPFSIKEVIARVNAVLTRTSGTPDANQLKKSNDKEILFYKDLVINSKTKLVSIRDRQVKLTKKEFEILYLLASNQEKLFSREEILDLIWKEEAYVFERTVDSHIARLRKKISPYDYLIINRSGYGYCFNINESE